MIQDQEFFKKIISLDDEFVLLEILETTFHCFSVNPNVFLEDLLNDIVILNCSETYYRRLEKILQRKCTDFS